MSLACATTACAPAPPPITCSLSIWTRALSCHARSLSAWVFCSSRLMRTAVGMSSGFTAARSCADAGWAAGGGGAPVAPGPLAPLVPLVPLGPLAPLAPAVAPAARLPDPADPVFAPAAGVPDPVFAPALGAPVPAVFAPAPGVPVPAAFAPVPDPVGPDFAPVAAALSAL